MQFGPLWWEDKMEYVNTQFFMRRVSMQCINHYQMHFWTIKAFLMTIEAKKSINVISKLWCPILHALKFNKQYS